MEALNQAYRAIERVLGSDTESLESVRLVETYRRFFRPEKVKIILLAESHVFTSEEDRKIAMPSLAELPGYPKQYARFVYCLGYGERTLTNDASHPKRDGTPQFWKILFSCDNLISRAADFIPILGCTTQRERVQNKIKLLMDLKARGIWLVDSSIVALYKGGQKVTNMFSALQVSWESYTSEVVFSAKPEHVICIGRGVANVVEHDLRKNLGDRVTVIPQPNAFLTSEEHMANYQRYSSICGASRLPPTAH